MIHKEQESLPPPDLLQLLLRPISDAASALSRLDERIARSPVGEGFVELSHFTDACASLWIDGELVHLEDLVLHDATNDIRTPTHELTIARDVLKTPPTHCRPTARLGAVAGRSSQPARPGGYGGGGRHCGRERDRAGYRRGRRRRGARRGRKWCKPAGRRIRRH